jgi:tRNA A-37 threonylcarbamoyl transferase component Bud32
MRISLAYRANYPRFSGRKERKLLQTVFTRRKSRILDKKVECDISVNCQPLKEKFFRGEYTKGSIVAKQFSRGVDPAQWFKMGNITLKQDKNITVKLLAVPGGDVVAKCFSTKNLLYYVKIWLKKERVLRMWKMAHYFKSLDIPIASPLGYIFERKGLWRTASYFYSQYLVDTCDLVVLSRNRKDFPNWMENEKIISRIARLLSTLHNNGFYHGDTKWANILANANTGKFWLIDLDGASRIRSDLDRGVRKDLSRFIVDMIENGLPKRFLSEFMSEYCKLRMLNKEHVLQKINPHISRTLERHKRKRNIEMRHGNEII